MSFLDDFGYLFLFMSPLEEYKRNENKSHKYVNVYSDKPLCPLVFSVQNNKTFGCV